MKCPHCNRPVAAIDAWGPHDHRAQCGHRIDETRLTEVGR